MNCQILLKEVVTETLRGYVTGGYLCTFNYILMENRKALPNEASNLVGFPLKWIIITRQKKAAIKDGLLVDCNAAHVCVCMSVQSCQYLSVIQNNLFLIAHTWYECRNRHNGTFLKPLCNWWLDLHANWMFKENIFLFASHFGPYSVLVCPSERLVLHSDISYL